MTSSGLNSTTEIRFDPELFARTHPYYLRLDNRLCLLDCGIAADSLLGGARAGDAIGAHLRLDSPPLPLDAGTLESLAGQAVVLQPTGGRRLRLGGAFYRNTQDSWLFLGYPQFGAVEELVQAGLTLSQFPRSDPMHFYIAAMVIKTNALRELETLARTLEQRVAERTEALSRANGELVRAREAAEAASLAKSLFLATMSHEIRTPMNGVLGMAELLMDTPLSDRQQHLAGTLYRSAESLLRIINDILDFSKIEAGKLELAPQDFDLPALVEEVRTLYAPRASAKGLVLETRLAEDVPPHLFGDVLRIKQVLGNLITNAVKFTEIGGIYLTVERLRNDPAGNLMQFTVRDTGISFDEETRDRLFHPFSQADSSMARRYGGTGLGLAICRQLVDIMGGTIDAVGSPGRGSEFRVCLLLENARATPAEPQAASAPQGMQPLHGHVLLAEDNPVNAELAVAMLQQLGLTVDMAATGEEACRRFGEREYDVVLMDCQMPVMDGFEAVRRIRDSEAAGASRQPRTPVIAITANAMSEDRQRCLAAGMDGYLAKPFRRRELYLALTPWLSASPALSS